mmetsp:Transcript_27245/g.33211  ORF Transcript_27245/g.33211 Transcript_27245/m.33211 type:complete len:406 (-) Transcript_27245:1288-2505(-)
MTTTEKVSDPELKEEKEDIDVDVDAESKHEVEEIRREFSHIEENLKVAQAKIREFRKLIRLTADIQEDVKKISLKSIKTLDDSKRRLKSLQDKMDVDVNVNELKLELKKMDERIQELREVRPETRSFFTRLVLGRVNVKAWNPADRIRLRDEYNKFKVRTSMIYLFFPLVVLFFHYYLRHQWKDTHWINIFYQLWLLYYYISLAMRENILLVNGSNIRIWWLYHHYIAALATVALLVWPSTDIYISYVPYYTLFAAYNGLVQNLTNWYHKNREYANRALGNQGYMDITYKETLTEFPKELLILLVFIFIAQAWEIGIGCMLFRSLFYDCKVFDKHWTEYTEELQVLSSGTLQIVMGAGNMYTTYLTILQKRNEQRKDYQKLFSLDSGTAAITSALPKSEEHLKQQ